MITFRIITLFIIVLFFTSTVRAQFHIGPKAGVNMTKINGKSFKDEFEYNYLVGAFVEIGIGTRFSINPEVLFSQTTSTRDTSFKNVLPKFNSDQTKAKLNYLAIPILLNMRLAGPIHIELGPQYSILMNSDKKLLENGEAAFKTGDFSMVGGAQIRVNAFRLSGRYVIGLSNISHVVTQDKWKNQAVQLSLGYAF